MNQMVDCEMFLYVDDSCLVYQHKNFSNICAGFNNLCMWSLYVSLSC